jgi:glutaconate CoA-transferase subunit B
MRFDPDTCEMVLSATHPGVTVEQVCQNTGWPLNVADDLDVTPAPTAQELEMIRRFDPEGYWSGG